MKEYAIIVAGGSGNRMQSSIPKQFLLLEGKPILFHTIEAFYHYSSSLEIIVVLPEKEMESWKNLVNQYGFNIRVNLTTGGKSRFESVKNGLQTITQQEGLVAVHDGVRPLVTKEIIGNAFQQAASKGNAVVAVSPKDSVRQIQNNGSVFLERNSIRLVQTPQTFQLAQLRAAYQCDDDESITDDASVVERSGKAIFLIEGHYENIKITTPEDLVIAEAILQQRRQHRNT
jgi:2-C-methyl-D-erythritol 4-phosphate cytidylyltransferase